MNPFVVVAAIIVAGAGVIAVTDRDPRVTGLSVAVVMIGSAFVLAPPPTFTAMAFRVVAGILAGYIVRIAVRRAPSSGASPLGRRAIATAAVAAFAAGLGVTPLVVQRSGPEASVAAGLALLVIVAPQVALPREAFRTAAGILLAACGALMLRAALGATPSAFEEVVEGLFIVALAATVTAAVVSGTARTRAGGSTRPDDAPDSAAGAQSNASGGVLGSRTGR